MPGEACGHARGGVWSYPGRRVVIPGEACGHARGDAWSCPGRRVIIPGEACGVMPGEACGVMRFAHPATAKLPPWRSHRVLVCVQLQELSWPVTRVVLLFLYSRVACVSASCTRAGPAAPPVITGYRHPRRLCPLPTRCSSLLLAGRRLTLTPEQTQTTPPYQQCHAAGLRRSAKGLQKLRRACGLQALPIAGRRSCVLRPAGWRPRSRLGPRARGTGNNKQQGGAGRSYCAVMSKTEEVTPL
jgi:hypothetical protein